MNAKDILSRRFEKATFNGYKTDDVDEFLREVSSEYSQLQKDKNELERKLEVLADKIREYRDDEDALKDALLLAQKQGNQIVNDSKAAAEKIRLSISRSPRLRQRLTRSAQTPMNMQSA